MRRNVGSPAFLTAALLLSSASASPVKKIRNARPAKALVERDSCAQTTYTVITPSPGAAATPVTAQFQSVYSCYPQYVVCNAQSANDCNTVYSTTSYQWVSTKVPCYGGMCLITEAYQPVTFSGSPTYAISTCTCDVPGNCVYGESTTYVAAPTSFPYVDTAMQYYVAPYNSYNDFHYGSSGGVGSLDVDVYTCSSGVCDIYPVNMVYSVQVTTNYVTYPINVNQYCPENTAIIVNGGINIDITINVSNAPTTVSTIVSGTSTVTSTKTKTTTKTITNAKTATKTTTALATATVTAGTSSAFVLEANLALNAKKRAVGRSFVSFSNGIAALSSSCTDATRFTLNSLGQIYSGSGYIYASAGDVSSDTGSLKLGSGAISTKFSFPNNVLHWVNTAFSTGDESASFCATKSGALTVLYADVPVSSDCIPITLTRIDPNTDSACNGSPSSTASSSASSSSGTGAVNINTSLRTRSSSRTSSTRTSSRNTGTTSSTASSKSGVTTTSSSSSSSSGTGDVNINTSLRSTTASSSSSSTGTTASSSTLGSISRTSSSASSISSSTNTSSSGSSITGTSTTTGSSTTTSSSATGTGTGVCATLTGLLQQVCIQINGDPCTIGGIAQVQTSEQQDVIRLCPNNISPSVQTCLNGVQTNALTTLGDCINGIVKLGSDPNVDSTCANLPNVNLQALCLTTGGSPCTDQGLSKVTANQQEAVVQLCANNLGPAAQACVNGVTNGLTTLDQCLAGLTQIEAAGNDPATVCPATIASVQVRALCIAVGGSLCTNAGIANVAASELQQVISACPNNISPAIQTCLNGVTGTAFTNLQDCVAGVSKIAATGADPNTACNGDITVQLQALCLTVGGDPCTASGIAKVNTAQQAAVIAACPNQISPAINACLAGTMTNGLTTLDACLAGVATLNGNEPATCSDLTTANLVALCLANDGQNPCDAAAILTLSATDRATRVQVCGSNAPTSVQTCVNDATDVTGCLNGIVSLGGGATADTTCAQELTNTLAANLGVACLTVGGDPCTKQQILALNTLALQQQRIAACYNGGIDTTQLSACANLGALLTSVTVQNCFL